MIFFNSQKGILYFSIVIVFFCCTPKDYGSQKMTDNEQASLWINRLRVSYLSIEKYNAEEIFFTVIPEIQKNKYVNSLKDTQYIILEENEYVKLTKSNLHKNYGLAIRAVYTHSGGDFILFRNTMNGDNNFIVQYVVMGSSVSEINKEVLIIEVDDLPKEIFIDYTVIK